MRVRVTGRAPSRLSQLEMARPDGQTPCQPTTVSMRASGPRGIGTTLRPVTHCQPPWFQKQGKAAKLAQPSDAGQPPPLLVQRSENQVWSVESGKGRCLVIPQSWRKPSCISVSSGPGLLTPWDFSGRQPWGGHSLRCFPLIRGCERCASVGACDCVCVCVAMTVSDRQPSLTHYSPI